MGEALEVAKALVDPAVKLIDIVQSAIGKAYEPRHIRKMADAKAYEISTVGQAMRDSSDIPIVYNKGNIELDTTDFDMFVKRTQNRMAYQELTKQNNIEMVVDHAYNILKDQDVVTNEPVDSDWLLRFFNSIQDISNTEMQLLWAKILAGEVKQPSSSSLRTLETLRNINKKEATRFQKICDYLIIMGNHKYLPNYQSLFSISGISYSDILEMDECGLMNSAGLLTLEKSIGKERALFAKNKSYIITTSHSNEGGIIISVPQFPLTAAGIEISRLFDSVEQNDYFIQFGREVKKSAPNATVCVYKIISEVNEMVNHELTDVISNEDTDGKS